MVVLQATETVRSPSKIIRLMELTSTEKRLYAPKLLSVICQCLLCEQLRIDERDDRGRLGGGAPGDRSLNGPFRRRRPAKIAYVPGTFWQRRRVDSRNILDVQKFHAALSFRVAAHAIGIKKMAFGRIGDHIEDFFCPVGWWRWSNEKIACRNAGALGNG